MKKTSIDYSFRLHNLRQIKSYIYEYICLELEKKYLLSECPDKYKSAKIRYTNTSSRHLNAKNKYIEYNNTVSYIDFAGIKSKIKSSDEFRIQFILEKISEITNKCNYLQKAIKISCHSINSVKSANEASIDFKTIKNITANEVHAANENIYISNKVTKFSSSMFQKDERHLGEYKEASHKNNSNLNNTFSNYLIGLRNEVYRSKNEILASLCLRNCGLCYSIEPFYPNSSLRADFGIFSSYKQDINGHISVLKRPKQIFIEIAGTRDKLEYESRLQHKIKIAKTNQIPLLVIDATDYKENVSKTVFDYEYLCNLFIELYFGIQEADGNIVTPYKNK